MRKGFTFISRARERGFTLIEILVVISLIGVLAGLVLVSFTGSQKQARDAGRKSDLKQYQNSLEVFANQQGGLYPSYDGVAASSICSDLGIGACPQDVRAGEAGFIDYTFSANGSGAGTVDATRYVLWAKLENAADYWVLCSDGRTGAVPEIGWADPTEGVCPL